MITSNSKLEFKMISWRVVHSLMFHQARCLRQILENYPGGVESNKNHLPLLRSSWLTKSTTLLTKRLTHTNTSQIITPREATTHLSWKESSIHFLRRPSLLLATKIQGFRSKVWQLWELWSTLISYSWFKMLISFKNWLNYAGQISKNTNIMIR